MSVSKKQKCPLCEGTGEYSRFAPNRQAEILELRKKGLTYREIMKITGIKSSSNIFYYLVGSWPLKKYRKV